MKGKLKNYKIKDKIINSLYTSGNSEEITKYFEDLKYNPNKTDEVLKHYEDLIGIPSKKSKTLVKNNKLNK